MKSIRFRLVIAGLAVLLGTALAKAQTSDAPPPPPMHEHGLMGQGMLEHFTKALNLSDEQQTQAKAVMQKEFSTMKPLMHQERQIERQLHQYAEGTYDADKVQALASQRAQLEVQLTVAKTRVHNELYQLLTPEQQTQLKQLEATHQARWQKRMQNQAPPAPPEEQ